MTTARASEIPSITPGIEEESTRKLTLGYWNIRGGCRGNPARYLLSYSGADWEDKQYTFGEEEWTLNKPTLMPFANLPHIIDGEVKIS